MTSSGMNRAFVKISKRLYPHYYEIEQMKDLPQRGLAVSMYKYQNKGKLLWEYEEMMNEFEYRSLNYGTNKKIHLIDERNDL
jgi:hypothetical protein